MKKRRFRDCVKCRLYNVPSLNKKLLCWKRGVDEICGILNNCRGR
ncbi:hypothetical protein [Hespellia stercorisuis]|nr:hypothetical protein [Hespellia stercorisuis]